MDDWEDSYEQQITQQKGISNWAERVKVHAQILGPNHANTVISHRWYDVNVGLCAIFAKCVLSLP